MSTDTKDVLVVLPVIGQPRFSKRIDMMLEQGHRVHAASFIRSFHKGRSPNCEVTYLGKIENQQYLSRAPKLIAAAFRLRKLIKQCDVVYAVGTDLVLLSLLAGIGLNRGLILETGDLREIQTRKSLIGSIFRGLDKFICKRIDCLVVTAPSFLDIYYRQWIGAKTPSLLLENKIESEHADAIKRELDGRPANSENSIIGIGYFGLLQSRWSLRLLKKLAAENPTTHSVLLAGFPRNLDKLSNITESTDNFKFFGEYKSPDDLAELYQGIDLSWACFSPIDPDDWKLRWARSNRFYEACAYETPLLSRQGSDEAIEVEKYKIGIVLDDEDENAAMIKVASITPEQIVQWKKNMQNLPKHVYSYTDETEKLSQAIINAAMLHSQK